MLSRIQLGQPLFSVGTYSGTNVVSLSTSCAFGARYYTRWLSCLNRTRICCVSARSRLSVPVGREGSMSTRRKARFVWSTFLQVSSSAHNRSEVSIEIRWYVCRSFGPRSRGWIFVLSNACPRGSLAAQKSARWKRKHAAHKSNDSVQSLQGTNELVWITIMFSRIKKGTTLW